MISIAASASESSTESLLKGYSKKGLSRKTREVSLRTRASLRAFSAKCGEMMASQCLDCKVFGVICGRVKSHSGSFPGWRNLGSADESSVKAAVPVADQVGVFHSLFARLEVRIV